jgi:hypothetical protein
MALSPGRPADLRDLYFTMPIAHVKEDARESRQPARVDTDSRDPAPSGPAGRAHAQFVRLAGRLVPARLPGAGAVDNSPRTARGVIRERLPPWGLGHLVEVAELVATEMITNSVGATREFIWDSRLPPVRVWLLGGDASVAVLVWDGVRRAPVPRAAGPGDESGRGLSIVEALSSQWDFYFPDLPFTGKVTRAFIIQA